jgi:hypothetical protein
VGLPHRASVPRRRKPPARGPLAIIQRDRLPGCGSIPVAADPWCRSQPDVPPGCSPRRAARPHNHPAAGRTTDPDNRRLRPGPTRCASRRRHPGTPITVHRNAWLAFPSHSSAINWRSGSLSSRKRHSTLEGSTAWPAIDTARFSVLLCRSSIRAPHGPARRLGRTLAEPPNLDGRPVAISVRQCRTRTDDLSAAGGRRRLRSHADVSAARRPARVHSSSSIDPRTKAPSQLNAKATEIRLNRFRVVSLGSYGRPGRESQRLLPETGNRRTASQSRPSRAK